MYLDKFDGAVWLCQWMHKEHGVIGNLFDSSAEAIWHGEKAKSVREAFRRGEGFQLCRFEACPFLQNNSLPDLQGEKLTKACTTDSQPRLINLAHDYTCNLACETCRPHAFRPPADYRQKIESINNAISPFLDKANFISLCGHGDAFASPYMMQLMEDLRPSSPSFSLQIETNGVYFDKKHWERIAHLAKHNVFIIVTVNSFDPFIYKQISKGGKYEKLMENLDFIAELRKKGDIKSLSFAMVIQDKNFREMPSFIERSREQYSCDRVDLLPVYQWGKAMTPDVFWFKDVLNPLHPYHKEYLELLDHPSLAKPFVNHYAGRSVHPARPFPGHSNLPENKE